MCVLAWTSKCIWEKSIDKIRKRGIMFVPREIDVAYTWLCGKVWQAGTARRGCVIHHVDWVKTNNVIENLVCVTVSEHERIHNTPGGKEFGEKLKKERGVGTPPGLEAGF